MDIVETIKKATEACSKCGCVRRTFNAFCVFCGAQNENFDQEVLEKVIPLEQLMKDEVDCGAGHTERRQMIHHMNTHHADKPPVQFCRRCGERLILPS